MSTGDPQTRQNKVQLAASHWKPRFTANGIDVNDFEKVLASTTEWKDWGPAWMKMGDAHRSLAEEAEGKGRKITATEAYQRAAWCYHLGKFLWFEDRAIHDELRDREALDRDRVGLMGISMGGIYGPRAAAHEKRLRAVVALAGPYDLSECWGALNPLTRGGYVFYTKSRDEAEAFEKAKTLSLRGILGQVTCPLLVVHGAKDRLFPPEQAERIAREAPKATLLMYPDGNHVCNNIPYKYRPAMADWMREQLTR